MAEASTDAAALLAQVELLTLENQRKDEENHRIAEETRRIAEEIRRQDEEIRRQDEEIRRQDEEIRRQDEESRRQDEESRRQDEESRRQDETLNLMQEEIRRKEEEIRRQEEEIRRQEEEIRRKHEALKIAQEVAFFSQLSNMLLESMSSGDRKTSLLKPRVVDVAELLRDLPSLNNRTLDVFRSCWSTSFASARCGADAIQENFHSFFQAFLSSLPEDAALHLIDCSRSGFYGKFQTGDLLFSIGSSARKHVNISDMALVGELKVSRKMSSSRSSLSQILERFYHMIKQPDKDRGSYWGFSASDTEFQIVRLQISFTDNTWNQTVEHSQWLSFSDECALESFCRLCSAGWLSLCQYKHSKQQILSPMVLKLQEKWPHIHFEGMLQRRTSHDESVEVAFGSLSGKPIVAKLFPSNKLTQMKTEREALQRLTSAKWGRFVHWIPAMDYHAQDGYGVLCTSPVGSPLPLASAFNAPERLLYCQELIVQLCSIILVADARNIWHMDVCPQNIVLLQGGGDYLFKFPLCLVDWGGSSFHGKENAGFQYHLAFSPSWLRSYDGQKELEENAGLCASLQQMVLTVFFIAFGDYFSWLPPKISTLHFSSDEAGTSRRTSIGFADTLYWERENLIEHLLDENFTASHCKDSIAEMLIDRKVLLDMFRALRQDIPWLFMWDELDEHISIDSRRLLEKISQICNVSHDLTAVFNVIAEKNV